jgi:hypothetical protein
MGWSWLAPTIVLTLVLMLLGAWVLLRVRRRVSPPVIRARFLQQREHLEADFMRAAAASGKPRGLHWKNCDWENDVAFARDRHNGELIALVGVTIQFDAVKDSDMENLPAVGNLRNASGVFFFRGGRWRTAGRAVFNFNPGEAIEHLKQQYERVELT